MSLTLQNVSTKINKEWIIHSLSFKVKDKECLAILGPSGCGKSTTLRAIAGLDKIHTGSIYINEEEITNLSPVDRKIGMVFQSYALFPHLTVYENLALGLKARGISKEELFQKVSTIISIMQIDHLSNRLPSNLSGGQRQRVALARALLRQPSIYLLDEPMSNLDAQLREELRPELRRLIIGGNQPVIYVTHDQQEAMAIANRIAVLNKGKLEQIATPKEMYLKPKSLFVAQFIGRPQINIFHSNDTIIKAIRPEDIEFSPEGYQAKVITREWLGVNQLLQLETQFGFLRMYCDGNLEINDTFSINWEKEKEHHFSKSSEQRLN